MQRARNLKPRSALFALAVGLSLISAKAQEALPVAEAAPTQNLPQGLSYVQSVEGVLDYRLTNDLEVLVLPDASVAKATVNIVYRVGSRHEVYGEIGMAHLLEHVLFKGTPQRADIWLGLRRHGARSNATTEADGANHYDAFAPSDDSLAWVLGLEADRMVNSYVTRKDLDSEMTVVRNEFEIDETKPDEVLANAMACTTTVSQ